MRRLVLLLLFLSSVAWAAELKPKVTYLKSPVARGKEAALTVKTRPGVNCQVVVKLKSGPSKAKGLEPKKSDQKGVVRWRWLVGKRTKPGKYPVVVTARQGKAEKSTKTHLIVK